MIEVERKFRLSNSLKRKIRKIFKEKLEQTKSIHQIDKVFLHGINSFKEFEQGMPIMRLRTENNLTKLTFKRNVNKSGDTIEHELIISSAADMESIMSEFNFVAVTTVIKDRLEFEDGGIKYALDSVNRLGEFLEIEVLVNDESQISISEQRIMQAAKVLGLTEADIENKKYDQLIAYL